jgi:hypothetical protein
MQRSIYSKERINGIAWLRLRKKGRIWIKPESTAQCWPPSSRSNSTPRCARKRVTDSVGSKMAVCTGKAFYGFVTVRLTALAGKFRSVHEYNGSCARDGIPQASRNGDGYGPTRTRTRGMSSRQPSRRCTRSLANKRRYRPSYYTRPATSLTRLACSGCGAWTLVQIPGYQKITNVDEPMTYVHSQYMEGSGWWGGGGKAGRASADQKSPPLVLELDTRKIWKTGRENNVL